MLFIILEQAFSFRNIYYNNNNRIGIVVSEILSLPPPIPSQGPPSLAALTDLTICNLLKSDYNNQHPIMDQDGVPSTSNEESLHQCPRCGRHYLWRSSFNRHLRHECGKERLFGCPHCPYRTNRKFSLDRHVTTQHNL